MIPKLILLTRLFVSIVLLWHLTGCGNGDKKSEETPRSTSIRPQAPSLGITDISDIQGEEPPISIGEFTTNPDDSGPSTRRDTPASRDEIANMPEMPGVDISASSTTDSALVSSERTEGEIPPDFSGVEDDVPAVEAPRAPASVPAEYSIDFTSFSGSAKSYLSSKGYEKASFFVSDIAPKKMNGYMQVGDSNDGFFGLRKKEITEVDVNKLKNVKTLKLNWAAIKHPSGENWLDKDKRRQSIGVVVSFGGKTSAGVPYFIGFVLSKTGPDNQYFKPQKYSEVGRYTTVARPVEGQFVQSTIDLQTHFKNAFGNVPYPGVSGLALEVDTRSMEGVGAIKSLSLH